MDLGLFEILKGGFKIQTCLKLFENFCRLAKTFSDLGMHSSFSFRLVQDNFKTYPGGFKTLANLLRQPDKSRIRQDSSRLVQDKL